MLVKDRATYSSADKALCMKTAVYLPSYVEWLTCLEMERDVRKERQQDRDVRARPLDAADGEASDQRRAPVTTDY